MVAPRVLAAPILPLRTHPCPRGRPRTPRGTPVEIPVLGRTCPAPNPIAGSSVLADGRIALPLQAPDSWFWPPGILNSHTGNIFRVPLEFEGDVMKMNWAGDGSLLALGWEDRTNLWRFRPRVRRVVSH